MTLFCFVFSQVAACLRDVCLDSERQRMARELSGCQKRRLSLAMALLADTKVKVAALKEMAINDACMHCFQTLPT